MISEKEHKTTKVSAWDLPDVPKGSLPAHLHLQKTRVLCTNDAPTQTENIQYSGAYSEMGVDNSTRLDEFRNNFRVEVIRLTEDDMEFDMIGIDAALANAFRRILVAELPTMAIEKVLFANNTFVVQDEVLAHRLGLVPLKVDPRLFNYKSENDEPNEKNTIVFKLHVRCEKGSSRINVKTDELKWLPNGSEFVLSTDNPASDLTSRSKTYTSFNCLQDSLPEFGNSPIAPKEHDILLAKLASGQEIELEAHAVKGMGKTHAKWSPVATAWYRMLPEVVLLQKIEDEQAEELVKKCPVGVFDIEDISKGRKRATVARPRSCTLCRECIREDGWDKLVALRRVKDHFIFTIESTGALPPETLFTEAVKILEDKCEQLNPGWDQHFQASTKDDKKKHHFTFHRQARIHTRPRFLLGFLDKSIQKGWFKNLAVTTHIPRGFGSQAAVGGAPTHSPGQGLAFPKYGINLLHAC